MRFFKLLLNSEKDIEKLLASGDPFWNLLMALDQKRDFMQMENFIMTSLSLMITNLLVCVFAANFVFDNVETLFDDTILAEVVIDILVFLYTVFIVWHGTNFDQLFSRSHVCIICILLFTEVLNMVNFILHYLDMYG